MSNRKEATLVLFLLLTCFFQKNIVAQDFWYPYSQIDSVNIWNLVVNSYGDMFASTTNPLSLPNHGGIYRSTDHGTSWSNVGPFPNIGGMGMDIDSYGSIYITAWNNIYKSSDNGYSWDSIYSNFNITIYDIKTGYDSIVLMGGMGGVGIVRSGNYGLTWNEVLPFPGSDQWITDFVFSSNGVIYATSVHADNGDDTFFKSEDFGKTWIPIPTGDCGCGYSYSAAEDQQGNILMGSIGSGLFRFYNTNPPTFIQLTPFTTVNGIVKTSDNKYYLATSDNPIPGYGGCMVYNAVDSSYIQQNSGLNIDNSEGMICDELGHLLIYAYGHIYRSNEAIITGLNPNKNIPVKGSQINPNPCNDFILITNNEPTLKKGITRITILGIDGRIYYKEAGLFSFPMKVSVEKLPQGLLFISIENDVYQDRLKLIHQ